MYFAELELRSNCKCRNLLFNNVVIAKCCNRVCDNFKKCKNKFADTTEF